MTTESNLEKTKKLSENHFGEVKHEDILVIELTGDFKKYLENVKRKYEESVENIKKFLISEGLETDPKQAREVASKYINAKYGIIEHLVLAFTEFLLSNNNHVMITRNSLIDIISSRIRMRIGFTYLNIMKIQSMIYRSLLTFMVENQYYKKIFEPNETEFLKKYYEIRRSISDKSKLTDSDYHIILSAYFVDSAYSTTYDTTKKLVEEFLIRFANTDGTKFDEKYVDTLVCGDKCKKKKFSPIEKLKVLKEKLLEILKNPREHKFAIGITVLIILGMVVLITKFPTIRRFFGNILKLVALPFKKVVEFFRKFLTEERIYLYSRDKRYRLLHESVIRKVDIYCTFLLI